MSDSASELSILDIVVKMSEVQSGDYRNLMGVSINFSLKKDPNTHESVQLQIGE